MLMRGLSAALAARCPCCWQGPVQRGLRGLAHAAPHHCQPHWRPHPCGTHVPSPPTTVPPAPCSPLRLGVTCCHGTWSLPLCRKLDWTQAGTGLRRRQMQMAGRLPPVLDPPLQGSGICQGLTQGRKGGGRTAPWKPQRLYGSKSWGCEYRICLLPEQHSSA